MQILDLAVFNAGVIFWVLSGNTEVDHILCNARLEKCHHMNLSSCPFFEFWRADCFIVSVDTFVKGYAYEELTNIMQ